MRHGEFECLRQAGNVVSETNAKLQTMLSGKWEGGRPVGCDFLWEDLCILIFGNEAGKKIYKDKSVK